MKKNRLALILGMLVMLPLGALATEPAISLEKVVSLAREQLKIRNLERKVTIQSVSLESSSLLGGRQIWKVNWSDWVDVGDGKQETGLEVSMKGEVVRLVKRTPELQRRP